MPKVYYCPHQGCGCKFEDYEEFRDHVRDEHREGAN